MGVFGFGRAASPAPAEEWFSKTYGARLGMRSVTFREAIERVANGAPARRTIVETGCVRERNDYSAGYSTVVFAEFARRYGGHVSTVDLSARNMALCRRVTKRLAAYCSYHVGDSIAFLHAWAGPPIDLLYLDSWDYPIFASDADAQYASQLHCLGELEAALPWLHARSLVLIDDGALPGGGKPLLAKRRMVELGWSCLIDAYQTLWSPAGASGLDLPAGIR